MKTLILIMIALFLTGCTGAEEISDLEFERLVADMNKFRVFED